MQANRHQAPPISRADKISAMIPAVAQLDNGIPLYLIESPQAEICRFDLIFRAGTAYQTAPLVAKFTNSLMPEGTRRLSAYETALKLEFYGAYLQTSLHKDYARISLSVLSSQLHQVLPLLEEIVKTPAFSEKEFELLKQKEKKAFLDDSQRVQSIATREFNELLFPHGNPYSNRTIIDDFDNIHPDMLWDFHRSQYLEESCKILIAGKLPGNIMEDMNRCFGLDDCKPDQGSQDFQPNIPALPKKSTMEISESIQNAIRIGKPTINMKHPDFHGLQLLNTILGGYFGSRLMSNIRVNKGYTYGIYSVLIPYLYTGIFFVSTETGSGVWKSAREEIYKEIDRLCNEEVGDDELQLVVNYLTGSRQRSLDCPLHTISYVKSLIEAGVDPVDYLKNELLGFQSIGKGRIQALARTYLNTSDMAEFICGRIN